MTREEAIICKIFLEDECKDKSCNEYKLLMGMVEAQPCEDAVSREAAKKLHCAICMDNNVCYRNKEKCKELDLFDKLPPVTPKQRMGKIIMGGYDCDHYICSECSHDFGWFSKPDYKYCPHCGAKMGGESE